MSPYILCRVTIRNSTSIISTLPYQITIIVNKLALFRNSNLVFIFFYLYTFLYQLRLYILHGHKTFEDINPHTFKKILHILSPLLNTFIYLYLSIYLPSIITSIPNSIGLIRYIQTEITSTSPTNAKCYLVPNILNRLSLSSGSIQVLPIYMKQHITSMYMNGISTTLRLVAHSTLEFFCIQ